MDTKQRDNAASPGEELKKLREKTDKDELAELKRRLLGGYRRGDVDQFVSRLKDQLQTVERTFKGHISELTEEKDRLRSERDDLLAKVAMYESAASAKPAEDPNDLKSMEEYAAALKAELLEAKSALDSAAAERDELSGKLQALSALADESAADLESKYTGLQARLDDQAHEYEAAAAGLRGELQALETRLGEKDEETAVLAGRLEEAEKKLARKSEEAQQLKGQLAETRQENCTLTERTAELERENEGLAAQLDVAKQNILRLISDKEAAEAANGRMREAMNSLVVKADAVIKENAVLVSQLDAERGRAQQYQAMHEKLSDTLARVRMASAMLDERVMEADKTLAWGSAQAAKPAAAGRRRAEKADLLDFTDGKSEALHDIICELNSIQNNLAQYQPPQPHAEADKKPNIRYSVEKLEVDCAAEKPDAAQDTLDKLMLPVNGEYLKNQ
jgi:chromosome segregation ATPase